MAKINTKPVVRHIALTLCLCMTVLRLLTTPTTALAATLSVTTSADSTVIDGNCSLREAIINTNDNADTWADCTGVGYGNDTISFAASVTTVILGSPLPNITDAAGLTINGSIPSGMVTLDGDGTFRVLSVDSGAILWLADLHIYDGQATGANGGGILNNGTLLLNNSFLSQNYAGQNGGAIFNASGSTVEITNSTLEFNQSNMDGGGIYNEGTLTVANSTLWENSANLAMSYYGGGIYNANGATLTLLNSTLSNNWNTNVYNASGGTLHFANTILANSDDCRNYGTIGTNTNNLIEYESNPALTCAGLDTIRDDPQLIQPTADNGGPTPTLALATGSLAIDAGDDAICAAAPIGNLDQRGVARPQHTHCDIGAYEFDGSLLLAATVNKTADTLDGSCTAADCSLREAVAAVANGGTIDFALSYPATITLANQIYLNKNLTINGPGASNLTISGNNSSRVFTINSGVTVSLADLHIYDGQAIGANGGAILNNGTLYLNNSFLSQNYADQNGGAIFNTSGSTVEITNSTLEFNQSNMDGGGIYNEGTLTVANSTLWENSANLAMSYYGGGIYNANGSTLTLLNSTLSNNWNTNVFNASGGTFHFANTILANSDDCRNYGTIGTNTNNLIEYESIPALTCAGLDTIRDDPQLIQPTADNGGPTSTLALATGSLAIDAGDDAICSAAPIGNLDQRGVARPQYAHCDIGAFEVDNLAPNDISISNTSVDENLPVGSLVGSLTTTDPDIGDTHTYNLQSGIPGCNGADNSSFQIPPGTNQLQTSVMFDYETPPTSFFVCIRTTDSGGLTYEEPFTITIIDVDDSAPSVNTILRQAPPTSPTNASTVIFRVAFSEDVQNVDVTDFNLVMTGTVTGGVNAVIPQSASVYDVQVTGVSGDGTLSLIFAAANDIEDLSGNPLGPNPTIGTEEFFMIDNSPIVVIVGGVVGNPDSLTIYDGGIYATQFIQLEITYNVDANDLGGGSDTDDVTNPDNYLLLQTGPDGMYDTPDCAGYASNGNLPLGDDIQIMTNPVTYNNNGGAGPFVAVVTLNGGIPLPYGEYRLMICGTTSITDLVGNPLNGGTDNVLTFHVGVTAMPATGYAPGHQIHLPIQHETRAYTSMGDLWLEIPRLNVYSDIIGVPLVEGEWDVTWLGHNVGWLEGTAFPTWEGNTVITGHVWDASNRPGIFSNLHETRWNDQVIIHVWSWKYTYEVRTVDTMVKPSDTRLLTKHEGLDWVTIVTCRGYDEKSESYSWRTVARAVLVKVEME